METPEQKNLKAHFVLAFVVGGILAWNAVFEVA